MDIKTRTRLGTIKILMLKGEMGDSGDYSGLINKPQINGVELNGNMTSEELSLASELQVASLISDVTGLESDVDNLQSDVGTLQTDVSGNTTDIESLQIAMAGLLNVFYPVGSYYETSDTVFNPNNEWGGTWELETEGLVHIGAGENYDVGDTGGESTVTLTKEQSGLPEHGHGFTQPKIPNHHHSMGNIWSNGSGSSSAYTMSSNRTLSSRSTATDGGGGSCTDGAVINNTGADASQAHNNMQPYIVVNRWHRIA